MLPKTTTRVAEHTAPYINRRISDQMIHNIAYYAVNPEEIDRRLEELDREWDIERTLETNASILSLTGLALGSRINRRWFALPAVVCGFLLQHALQGWCPPVPILRRFGIRTQSEIEEERFALKALRGDFKNIPAIGEADIGQRASSVILATRDGLQHRADFSVEQS